MVSEVTTSSAYKCRLSDSILFYPVNTLSPELAHLMATSTMVKPPEPLNLEDRTHHRGDNWLSMIGLITRWLPKSTWRRMVKSELCIYLMLLARTHKTFTKHSHSAMKIQKDITKALAAFEARYVPETNVIYERYMFNRCVQEPGETIDHYITNVIKLAENCQYGGLRDNLIRDKLVSGIRNNKVREKLLGTKDHNTITSPTC